MSPLAALSQILAGLPVRSGRPRVAVAWSGGLDSTVLLHCATLLREQLDFDLLAIHIHHGLQPSADQWAALCAEQAAAWQVPLSVMRVRVDAKEIQALGLEAAARAARYGALARCPVDLLLLAHHRDDQAETVLLQLLRGAGPAGLAAMGADSVPASHLLRHPVARPFLALPRERLLDWAQVHALLWSEDPSNADTRLDRNHIRQRVGPVLAARFPAWQAALARSAAWAAEAQALLAELAELDLKHIGDVGTGPRDPACLPVAASDLRTLSEVRQRNLLRHLLSGHGVPSPPAARLTEWLIQLAAPPDRCPELVWQDWILRRWGGHLWLEPRLDEPVWKADSLIWEGREAASLFLPGCGMLQFKPQSEPPPDAPGAGSVDRRTDLLSRSLQHDFEHGIGNSALSLREGCGALRLAPCSGSLALQVHAGGPHRLLRKLFQERRVPPWRRARVPGLFAGRELVAVPGVAVAAAWHGQVGEDSWQLIWRDAALCPS